MAERPWTAEIASPFDGLKSKYNIPLHAVAEDGTVTNLNVPPPVQPVKAPTVKQRKEQWASQAAKGVDFVRDSVEAPNQLIVEKPSESPAMLQVRVQTHVVLFSVLAVCSTLFDTFLLRASLVFSQGFFASQHPKFGDRSF